MNKKDKFSLMGVAVSFFVAGQAGAANGWTEARNDAMGGTGVASANYGSGVLINPALLAKAKPDDDITLIAPTIGGQISDKDNLRSKIDDIIDDVNNYRQVLSTIDLSQLLIPNSPASRQVSAAAGDLAKILDAKFADIARRD